MSHHEEKSPAREHGTVWTFLVIGVLVLLAGIFVRIPGASESLPKAEVLTGAFLMAGAVIALLITW